MPAAPRYLIIGNGRIARHFLHYFGLLGLPCAQWHRGESVAALPGRVAAASHVLVLISDRAIDPFVEEHLLTTSALKVHFSGALASSKAYGAHPLMTFNPGVYSLDKYRAIPFVVDADAPDFGTLLPGLPNPHYTLPKPLKAKYHAMCVLAGNFSCILWQKFFETLEAEFHLPKEAGHPYLRQQMDNLIGNPATALTGPLVRDDRETIAKHLVALEGDPFQAIYRSFVETYAVIKAKRT